MDINKLISFNNYTVYYVMNKDYSYYISIPHHKDLNYHMAIDLDKYIDILSDNIANMNKEIKDIYTELDNTSMILILPNIASPLLNNLNTNDDYIRLAKKVTAILNNAHKLLSVNHFTIDTSIYFLDDLKYTPFITYFKNKFIGRVHNINLLQILKEYNLKNQGYEAYNNAIKINMGGVNYIVGTNNIKEEDNKPVYQEEYVKEENQVKEFKKSYAISGNASYLLLGTLSVLISIILLILLLR